jgi:AcrR family transcriptional regulator
MLTGEGTIVASLDRHKRPDRMSELLDAALVVFAEKGYSAASVQNIADSLNLLKGSLYHYIDSKEDLLYQLFDRAHLEAERLMTAVDELDADPVEKLRYYIEGSVIRSLRDIELTSLYFRDWRHLTGERREKLAERRRGYDLYLRRLIREAYESRGVEAAVDLRYISSFVIAGTNWAADWFRADGPDSVEVVARGYTELAMASVLGSVTTSAV